MYYNNIYFGYCINVIYNREQNIKEFSKKNGINSN